MDDRIREAVRLFCHYLVDGEPCGGGKCALQRRGGC